jgi:N-acetylmuramoyl-L-alanine amidase
MSSDYQDDVWEHGFSFWWQLGRRNLPVVIFLVLAFAGMLTIYWYFSPSQASTETVAASTQGDLSAPFYKPVPAKPIIQRLPQSPGPVRVGIIAGHKGSDSGTVCSDGFSEAEINMNIAQQLVAALRTEGVHAEVLDEFDPRLGSYGATAVISIHADSCTYINDQATGYKVAGSTRTDSNRLQSCVEQAYGQATQLPYHANTITPHMTDYHAFRTLPIGVPAIIIEVGFMNLDRELLTTNDDIAVTGILNGIHCYLNSNE